MNECIAANTLSHAAWGLFVLAVAGFSWFVGLYRVHQASYRGQDKSVVASSVRLEAHRLKLRRRRDMVTYADIKGGDTPFTVPQTPNPEPDKSIGSFAKRYPELTRRLQETAQRLAQEKGRITSDDVWRECPIPKGIEPKVMAAAFLPKAMWRHVGYQKCERPERNGGTVGVWELRKAQAA